MLYKNLKVLFGAFLLIFVLSFSDGGTQEVTAAHNYGYDHYHVMQYGETLWGIGIAYGMPVSEILHHNPHIYNPNWVPAGTVILIPGHHHNPHYPQHYYCRYNHYVMYGQTLSQIAAWYGSNVYSIAHANGIANTHYIYAGQYLCIP